MGLFPFASTVGTMSYFQAVAPDARRSSGAWRPGAAVWWCDQFAPAGPSVPRTTFRSSFSPFHPSVSFASCLRTARCPDAVARPAGIREGVSRRTSGQTFSRSERGHHAMAERGPPSPLRPPC